MYLIFDVISLNCDFSYTNCAPDLSVVMLRWKTAMIAHSCLRTVELQIYIRTHSQVCITTRVCSCNIFNWRAKQLVKVICTLTS